MLCFHHAGGSASVFKRLADLSPPWLEVCAVQLPGRENLDGQPFADHITHLIPGICEAEESLAQLPTIVLGHSLGAFIAFEYVKQHEQTATHLTKLVCLASRAPHLNDTRKNLHQLDDAALVQKLIEFEGTPSQVLQDADLLKLFLPRIRADFKLTETYLPIDLTPIEAGIVSIAALEDSIVPPDHAYEWNGYSNSSFDYFECPGSHFFLHDNLPDTASKIFSVAHASAEWVCV